MNTQIADWAAAEIARIRADRDKPPPPLHEFLAKLERDKVRYAVELSRRKK